MLFSDLFRSDSSTRDKFLSRLFGIFSEEIVRCWASAPEAPYEDLGRPTVKAPTNESRGYTLDFTFRSKADDAIYIVEMKSELQYQNYKYLILSEPSQTPLKKGNPEQNLLKWSNQKANDPNRLCIAKMTIIPNKPCSAASTTCRRKSESG